MRKHFIRNFTVVFLAGLLVLGGVLFTVTQVKKSRAVLLYGNQTVSEGEYNYFASYYKTFYMAALRAAGVSSCTDTASFWNGENAAAGKTYGALLAEYVEKSVSELLVRAELFDLAGGSRAAAKTAVRTAVENLISYRAGGDEKTFAEMLSSYGFDEKDLYRAGILQYCAAHATEVLFGESGENLADETEACDGYFEKNYVAVKLLLIRDTDTPTDEGYRPLTVQEKQARADDIAAIRTAIENIALGESGQMSETAFDMYVLKYDTENEEEYRESGYYFAKGESYTVGSKQENAALVDTAFGMKIGEFAEVETDDGTCFLYRIALADGAYESANLAYFFADFYTGLAEELCAEKTAEAAADVTRGKRFDAAQPVLIPYNYDCYVRF